MAIRIPSKEDAPEIQELVASLAHFYLDQGQKTLPQWFSDTLATTEFEKRLKSFHYDNLVYDIDNEIVGYVSMKDNSHLYHLFVAQEHQGKGVARALWDSISQRCVASKYTVRASLNAVPVYKAFGFVESEGISEKEGIRFQTMELINRRAK